MALINILCNDPIIEYIKDVLLISFWNKHEGAWFIATIIPLYLLSPLLFLLLRKGGTISLILKTIGLIAVVTIFCILDVSLVENQDVKEIFNNIQFALSRTPIYLIGFAIAPYAKNETRINTILLLICILGIFLLFRLALSEMYRGELIAIAIVMLFILFLQFVSDKIAKYLRWFGSISLESYLTNIYLGTIFSLICLFPEDSLLAYGNYMSYCIILSSGILMAYSVHTLLKPVLNIMNLKIDNR